MTEQRQTGAAGFSNRKPAAVDLLTGLYMAGFVFVCLFCFTEASPLSENSGSVNTMYAYHHSLIGQCPPLPPHPSTNPSLTPAGNHSNSMSASWCDMLPVDSHLKLILFVLTLESEEIN